MQPKNDVKEMTRIIIEKTRLDRNRILASNDAVVKKMSKVEQEQAADTIGNIRRDERLDDLEQDVKQVKGKLNLAPSAA